MSQSIATYLLKNKVNSLKPSVDDEYQTSLWMTSAISYQPISKTVTVLVFFKRKVGDR